MSDLPDPSVPSDVVARTSTSERDGAPSAAPVHDVESSPAQPLGRLTCRPGVAEAA